eukprot:m.266473 g.266473  ORF g.266473 m.266473 type:complete len:193 (+) comp67622_c0_seq1:295-873(+)
MFGVGELLFITIAGAVVIGPKGMPRFANQIGFYMGRSMSFLQKGRQAVTTFSQQNNISDMHGDLQKGLHDVNKIKAEWDALRYETDLTNMLFRDEQRNPPQSGADVAPHTPSPLPTPPPPASTAAATPSSTSVSSDNTPQVARVSLDHIDTTTPRQPLATTESKTIQMYGMGATFIGRAVRTPQPQPPQPKT